MIGPARPLRNLRQTYYPDDADAPVDCVFYELDELEEE